ncbi:MAG: transporter [Phycisphaerae bacterium]|nr:transporter [Phycisphaerae bacterium]
MSNIRVAKFYTIVALVILTGTYTFASDHSILPESNHELYTISCASCHGANGRGASPGMVGFDVPLPDFTDCNFVTREPAADWIMIAREGGPARGFSEIMPAFGDALTTEQLEKTVTHIKKIADCPEWPVGELNFPKALYTTKAFPEDELVFSSNVTTDGLDKISNKLIYERRIGARSQVEIAVPFGWHEIESANGSGHQEWTSEIGDVALGVKHVLFHDFSSKSIVSLGGEVILPTGNEDEGFGHGTTVFEPYIAYGQLLPENFFLQFQGGFKFPCEDEKVQDELFYRMATGKTFTLGRYGSNWSPMVEILGAQNLDTGESPDWDIVPQIQIALNRRQHVRLGVGVKIPLNDRDTRNPVYGMYLLWDMFDGGFFDGW